MITRRSMLLGLGAALAAPAIVKADNLMKLWVPPTKPFAPSITWWDVGDQDSTAFVFRTTIPKGVWERHRISVELFTPSQMMIEHLAEFVSEVHGVPVAYLGDLPVVMP